MQSHIPSNIIRQLFFLGIILFLGVVLMGEMYFTMSAFLGAITVYILARNLMFRLQYTYKWKPALAAIVIIIISLVLIVMPFVWVFSVMLKRIEPVFSNHQIILDAFTHIDGYISREFNMTLFTADNIKQVLTKISSMAPALIGSTVGALTNLLLMYFLIFFMLINGKEMEEYIKGNLPINDINTDAVIREVKNMVLSNAIGIPVLAIIQGLMAMVGYWIFGVHGFLLFGIVTGICSVVPVLGTMVAWVPIAVYSFATGNSGSGIGIVLWGIFVIGLSDNIFRFMLQKKLADVHPLITLFGVIVGVNMFGFMGLIFGPLMISSFILLLKVYKDEFHPGKNAQVL